MECPQGLTAAQGRASCREEGRSERTALWWDGVSPFNPSEVIARTVREMLDTLPGLLLQCAREPSRSELDEVKEKSAYLKVWLGVLQE